VILVLAAALALQAQDPSARVAEQVARLKSDDPKVRIAATDELVKLGRPAMAALEGTKSDDPEVRSRIAQAIQRIQAKDPFFLVRSVNRPVSVSFLDLPFSEAHARAFAGFRVPIPTDGLFFGDRRISMTADQAGYWEVVEKFAAAAQGRLEVGLLGPKLVSGRPGPRVQYLRHDRFLIGSMASRKSIELRLFGEPGLQPVDFSFKLDDVTDGAGMSFRKSLALKSRNDEVTTGHAIQGGTIAVLTATEDGLPDGTKVSIDGTVLVDLAADVEAVEFRKSDETRTMSDWRLSVTDVKFDPESFKFTLNQEELKGWKRPEERPYLGMVWVIVSDDEGRAKTIGRLGYGGAGGFGIGSGWDLPGRPTRLVLVRPTAIERVEVPVRIRGLAVSD
jgi:hypothetical protein